MGNKSTKAVFIKVQKKEKGVPVTVLKDLKVATPEAADKKLAELLKKEEPYIEVHNSELKIKTVYTKPKTVRNYTKKESKL